MNMFQHESNGKSIEATPAPESFTVELWNQLRISIVATLTTAVIVCGIYPAVVWGLAQMFFPFQANGSLIGKDGKPAASSQDVAGSLLIGQNFSDAKYFHPRPSSAGACYDATASSGSNLGPTSAKLFNGTIKKDDKGHEVVDFDGIRDRVIHYTLENGLPYEASPSFKQVLDDRGNVDDVKLIKALNADSSAVVFMPKVAIPPDAVTGSASGLDPQISVENAMLQAPRVARVRGMKLEAVQQFIRQFTQEPALGIFGDPAVNVLRLNLTLDQAKQ